MGPRGRARGFIALRSVDAKTKKPQQVPINPAVRAALSQSKASSALSRQPTAWRGGELPLP